MPKTTAVITAPGDLADFGAELSAAPAIGLDTEFVRERTYRAELCLVQASTDSHAACIDPLALESLAPLAAALGPQGPLKVLHAARQDLEVLWAALGRVAPVFDTQVAAALAGFAAQIGYADLVRQVLGHELPKAHTRTDWTRRPLTAEQLEYALDDVRHLLSLRDALLDRLDRLGRVAWLAEELDALGSARDYAVDPDRAWQRLKGLQALDAGRQRLAQALAAWRERRAIDRNRPRGWILDDAALREIVATVPRDSAALAAIAALPPGTARHSGPELLALVHAAAVPDPPPPLPRRERPDPAVTSAVKRLAEVTRQVATETGIGAELLAPRRELERIATGDHEVAALRGWRKNVVGERLLQALHA